MSLFNRQSIFDGLATSKINAISLGDITSPIGNVVDTVFPGAGTLLNTGGQTVDRVAEEAGGLWDDITGQTGAEAAERAGGIQANAIMEAARLAGISFEEMRGLIEQQIGTSREQFSAFQQAGLGALPGVQEASTIGGLDQRLAQIMGSDSFQPLVDRRTRSVKGMLGAGGLKRSGAAITEGAKIPTELAFEIENMLSGRDQILLRQDLMPRLRG